MTQGGREVESPLEARATGSAATIRDPRFEASPFLVTRKPPGFWWDPGRGRGSSMESTLFDFNEIKEQILLHT